VSDKDEPNEYDALHLGNIAKTIALLTTLRIESTNSAMRVSGGGEEEESCNQS
jgi:hypothetical protein